MSGLFEFSIKTDDGKLIVTETVQLGNEVNPFPNDWESNPIIISGLEDLKKEILNKYIKIDYKEVK